MTRVCRHFPQMKMSSKFLSSSDDKFLQCGHQNLVQDLFSAPLPRGLSRRGCLVHAPPLFPRPSLPAAWSPAAYSPGAAREGGASLEPPGAFITALRNPGPTQDWKLPQEPVCGLYSYLQESGHLTMGRLPSRETWVVSQIR